MTNGEGRMLITLPAVNFVELPAETEGMLTAIAAWTKAFKTTTDEAIAQVASGFVAERTSGGVPPTTEQLEQFVRAMLGMAVMWGVDTGRVTLETE